MPTVSVFPLLMTNARGETREANDNLEYYQFLWEGYLVTGPPPPAPRSSTRAMLGDIDEAVEPIWGELDGRLSEGELSATYEAPTAIADAATYGDDLTDAKAHFQAKADALAAAGGGTLVIPRGIYRLSGPLLIPSNVSVRGEGAATVLKATYTGSGLVYNAGAIGGTTNEDVTVSDLTVDGSGTANNGVIFAGVQRGTIHNVRVKNCTGYGIWIWRTNEVAGVGEGTPSRQVTVSDCHVTDAMDVGIEFSGCIGCTMVGNTVEASTMFGIYVWNGAQDCTVTGNVVVGTGATNTVVGFGVQPNQSDPVMTTPTRRITFTGNVARNVNTGFEAKGYSGRPVYDVIFNGNVVRGLDARGAGAAVVVNGHSVRVANNMIVDFNEPIRVDVPSAGGTPGDSRGVTLDSNVMTNCHTALVYGLNSGSVSGNTFNASTNTAVNLLGCSNLVCNNNVFRNLGTSGQMPGFLVQKYLTTESMGCTFNGNKISDDRATKYSGRAITFGDASDRHVCIGNSAWGSKAGSVAVLNAGTGANNVIANNIDQP